MYITQLKESKNSENISQKYWQINDGLVSISREKNLGYVIYHKKEKRMTLYFRTTINAAMKLARELVSYG